MSAVIELSRERERKRLDKDFQRRYKRYEEQANKNFDTEK